MALQRPAMAFRALRIPQHLRHLDTRHQLFSTAASTQSKAAFEAAPPIDLSMVDTTPARIIPASPSYFTGTPVFTDSELKVERLLWKYGNLPKNPHGEEAQVTWSLPGEDVSVSRKSRLMKGLRELNRIREEVMPPEVASLIGEVSRSRRLIRWKAAEKTPDENGRAKGVGRRKTAHATAYLVEGDGQIMINGKNIAEAFPRIHDRESAIWALKATNRLHKYNVFAVVRGGGLTGQAEAVALAVSKAALVHEPGLKSALRRAGVIRTDPRQVERKKPGKLKARKMPAWVKR